MSETHVWIDSGKMVRETEKAELHETGAGELWIPKSCIGAKSEGRIEVKRWWAEKNGVVDDGKDVT